MSLTLEYLIWNVIRNRKSIPSGLGHTFIFDRLRQSYMKQIAISRECAVDVTLRQNKKRKTTQYPFIRIPSALTYMYKDIIQTYTRHCFALGIFCTNYKAH